MPKIVSIEKILHNKAKKQVASQPVFYNFLKRDDRKKAQKLFDSEPSLQIIDSYEDQLRELFAIKNPPLALKQDFEKTFQDYITKLDSLWRQDIWVYLPWACSLVHILNEQDFFTVRTARNKLLITEQEQIKFYNATVGIAGLSIGNSVAIALVLQGGAKHLKLADFDKLALSNTNRVRAGVHNLGLAKITITKRQIYEINPYVNIETFPEGLTEKNIERFVKGSDILVDEMDSLALKALLRKYALKYKIPIIMGADNADMAVIDIERYDKSKKIRPFHGRIKDPDYETLKKLNKIETSKTIAKLIGLENHTKRMLLSLHEMGKSIVSWPQLGGTAILNGAAVAYCVRKIICGNPILDNRALIALDQIFLKDDLPTKKILNRKNYKSVK